MFMSPFFLLVNIQDIKFAPLKQNIWLSTRLLKVTMPLKAKENVVFEDDYHKGCWNVCLMCQQWPYSGQHPPRRSRSTYVWNDSWAQTLTVNETISNLDHIARSVPNQLVFTFWEDLVYMADLSNIWKRLYRYKTTHPDVDRSFTSWFSSQMDIRKFVLFVFLLNLGILPLTVKGMPLFFSS